MELKGHTKDLEILKSASLLFLLSFLLRQSNVTQASLKFLMS